MYFARRMRWKGQTLAALSAAVILTATSFAGVSPVAASRGVPFVRTASVAGSATVSSTCPVNAGPVADVNMDGGVGISDLGNISGRWGREAPNGCGGWIRADANSDGGIGLGDYGKVTAKWGQTGYVPPTSVTNIIFVHGIGAWYTGVGFTDLLPHVSNYARYGRGITYEDFQYIQDKGDPNNPTCNPRTVMLPGGYSIANKINWAGWDQAICDSNSDIGLNAIALWQEVVTNYNSNHGKTILIANSSGAAIVRGMLAYSTDLGDRVASTIVDSVFFLEGTQSGSYLAGIAMGARSLGDFSASLAALGPFGDMISTNLVDEVTEGMFWKTGRPQVAELDPGSAWFGWANSYTVPNLPYFNAYGDISVGVQACIGPLCGPAVGLASIGDGVLLPDEAQFQPYGSDSNHLQYRLQDSQNFNAALLVFGAPGAAAGALALANDIKNSPVSHFSLNRTVGQVQVAHCGSGASWFLAQEYENLIYRRILGYSSTCNVNDRTDLTGW